MRYITPLKQAENKGAAGSGTEHHWYMMVSSVGLALIMPFFLVAFGRTLGGDRAEVLAVLSNPLMAILTGLVIFFGLRHFASGAQTMIEDYAQGGTRKGLIIAVTILSYGMIAVGLFALAKIAL
jgi:succinate dehydrogenase / fumarate reductase membrane anchor subunit